MTRLSLIITILTILNSCQTSKQTLYGKCGKHYFVCIQILLKDSSRFEYFQFYDVGGTTTTSGNWQKYNDTLILNTFEQKKDRLNKVLEEKIDSLTENIIELENGLFGFIEINGFKIEQKGQKIYFKQKAKEIKFVFYENDGSLSPVIYKVKNPNANYFRVTTKTLTSSIIFSDEKFLLKGKKLYAIGTSWNLERTNLKNKQW